MADPSVSLSDPLAHLQLVLQFSEPRSKPQAARRSRTTRPRASAPFAWKHTPLRLRVDSNAAELVFRLNSSPLLQHAPLHLVYDSWRNPLAVSTSVSQFPRFHTLEVFDAAFGPALNAEGDDGIPRPLAVAYSTTLRENRVALLRLPALKGVRSLITHCAFNRSCVDLIGRFPALSQCQCDGGARHVPLIWYGSTGRQ
jgi:hypothetical protein